VTDDGTTHDKSNRCYNFVIFMQMSNTTRGPCSDVLRSLRHLEQFRYSTLAFPHHPPFYSTSLPYHRVCPSVSSHPSFLLFLFLPSPFSLYRDNRGLRKIFEVIHCEA